MGWDMGPPFWPYQAIYLLLFTINAPAFVLSMPILKLLNLQTLSLQYGVWFRRWKQARAITSRSCTRPAGNEPNINEGLRSLGRQCENDVGRRRHAVVQEIA